MFTDEQVSTVGCAATKKRSNNIGALKADLVATAIQDEILRGRLSSGVLLESE
jgi:GntR family transcriptional regulator